MECKKIADCSLSCDSLRYTGVLKIAKPVFELCQEQAPQTLCKRLAARRSAAAAPPAAPPLLLAAQVCLPGLTQIAGL